MPDLTVDADPAEGSVFARPIPSDGGAARPASDAPVANVFALPRPATDPLGVGDGPPDVEPRPLPDTVDERWERRHRSIGIRTGSFVLRPEARADVGFDSNPNRTPSADADLVSTAGAVIAGESDWVRHQLNASAAVEQRLFAATSELNQTVWTLGIGGRLEASRDTVLTASAGTAQQYTDRNVSEEIDLTPLPTRYRISQLNLGGEHRFGRLALQGGLNYEARDFADTRTPAGTVVDQQYRDVDRLSLQVSPGIEVGPNRVVFATVLVDQLDYRLDAPRLRDSRGISVLAGVRGELTPLVRGRLSLGVLSRDYEAAGFDEGARLAFDAQLDWLATDLSTVRFEASRRIVNSANTLAPVELRTQASLGVSHELRRDVRLTGSYTYRVSNYAGLGSREKRQQAELGAEWFLTRHWRAYGSTEVTLRRAGTLGGVDYDRFVTRAGLGYHF